MPIRYFEDFETGQNYEYGGRKLSKDEMVAFATVYDGQPMHIDADAAKTSFVGTLIASGWHTIAIGMRMIVDHVLGDAGSMGAPGVEELKWLKPVLPGDTLSQRMTITGVKASNSKPDRGFVWMSIETLNQRSEVVIEQRHAMMIPRRSAGGQEPVVSPVKPARLEDWYGKDGKVQGGIAYAPVSGSESLPRFGALEVGRLSELGACRFSSEDIIAYGRCFDPQPFHLDETSGRASHFGGLIASGWQTANCWMKLMNENRIRRSAAMLGRGEAPPQFGPSPGFKDMRWLKPVRAGDTIRYSSTVVAKRASVSRPQWGIVNQHNQGFNEAGEPVFEFTGTVFWEV